MPQYDESFILDDNANQRRNKRSYRVSRKGLLPSFHRSSDTVGGNGTYVLKNNINNLKKNKDFASNHMLKENSFNDSLYSKNINKSFPSLLDDPYNRLGDEKNLYHANGRDIYAIKNNNYYSVVVGKSLEDLASNGQYSPLKNYNSKGKSLQNLNENFHVPLIAKCYNKSTSGHLNKVKSKESIQNNGNHYIVNDTAEKKSKRLYETNAKLKERTALKLAARFLESGVYRQLGKTRPEDNEDSGFSEETNGIEVAESGGVGSGHKASFRSANKLARRARSFKEDLLERISAMRSPGAPASALPSLRSQSPLSPKNRSQHKVDNAVPNPAKELEGLVKQIKFELRHFRDVIKKKKLEMLPGNGTIILETITNIHGAIGPLVSPLLAENPSADLESALNVLRAAGADLIKFCDESMIAGDEAESIDTTGIFTIIDELQAAVENLSTLALEKLAEGEKVNTSHAKTNGTIDREAKNKLQIRPIVDNIRNSTNENQRNSLPDIPLTPREREMLEGAGSQLPFRNSHSIESILDMPSNQEPPPKPPVPIRRFDVAPPLPPKRKPNENLPFFSTQDRVSLQSHSSGSLDSMLNTSNDDEICAIMDRSSINFDDFIQNTIDKIGVNNSQNQGNNRLSLESNSTVSTIASQHRHSNEIARNSLTLSNAFGPDLFEHQSNNHNRLSSESGFVSMGTARNSEVFPNLTNLNQTQKMNILFIDSTPTPVDPPDSSNENNQIVLSPLNTNFDISNSSNVMQHISSNNFMEKNSKTFLSNSSTVVSHSSVSSKNVVNQLFEKSSSTKLETSSFIKMQRNITQSTTFEESNISNFNSSIDFSSSQFNAINSSMNGVVPIDTIDATIPPALPVKTRKLPKAGFQTEFMNEVGLNPSFDDHQHVNSCALHGPDGLMQRPHTLADQSLSSGQPPPLPMKKKHMFQSVAYSVMAYMEMFGNYSRSPQTGELMRHSVHEQHQHSANLCMSSHHLSNASIETTAANQTIFTKNGFSHNSQSIIGNKCNQQLTQSHTLHQFNLSSNMANTSQTSISGFSSPLKSPRLVREDSIKSDRSSIASISTNSSIPQTSPCSNVSVIPPALPPKRTKLKTTPNHSPAKPPLSPKPHLTQMGTASPSTPCPLICDSPSSGRISTSPIPKFQFDPPPLSIDNTLLLNPDEEQWQQSINKPGKFPTDDLDLEPSMNTSPSPSPREIEPCIENNETESDPDIMLEMDVSSRLVWKAPTEDEPDIRGGHPDALVVHAIKSTKDFSEAFLTTYRTFVSPILLIEKLEKRHGFLIQHGQYSKSREVQSLLIRVVVDLTIADLDEKLLAVIRDFNYGLIRSGDLQMAKTLRVIFLEKMKHKQLQPLQAACQWFTTVTRRDSLLDQKAESIAEQMTLLDAELFTRIPAPEALLWAQDQCEERSPNLTRFTEHFNKMSYWARSRILEQEEAKDREKLISKFLKVMKYLRKFNNFNSYLALLSALDSGPIRRLDWQKYIVDGIKEYCVLIDSSSSFKAYRQALLEAQPPCIPYLGMVLQDLTFVHIGNNDLLPDGHINFLKRWQQFKILENMKRFSKAQYTFKKNEKIIAIFNGFDEVMNEETMWQMSENIKPRPVTKKTSNS